MSGNTENRASEASERAGGSDNIMTWHASRAMLPLVGRIAGDIVTQHKRLACMQTELRQLEAKRRTLDWPGRQRRYQLEDEIKVGEAVLTSLVAELTGLGLSLLDAKDGAVGFPTLVNDRKAFFNWKAGEEVLGYWSYAGDNERHTIPEEWALPRQSRGKAARRR